MGGGFTIWTLPSDVSCPFYKPFGDFPDLSGLSRFCWGFSQWVLFFFLSLLKHLQGTFPKGPVTQSGPFPKKWETPGLQTLWFSFSQVEEESFGHLRHQTERNKLLQTLRDSGDPFRILVQKISHCCGRQLIMWELGAHEA